MQRSKATCKQVQVCLTTLGSGSTVAVMSPMLTGRPVFAYPEQRQLQAAPHLYIIQCLKHTVQMTRSMSARAMMSCGVVTEQEFKWRPTTKLCFPEDLCGTAEKTACSSLDMSVWRPTGTSCWQRLVHQHCCMRGLGSGNVLYMDECRW